MQVYKIDENGYFVKDIEIKTKEEMSNDCVEIQPPQGLYKAKWTGNEWIEDMPQEKIDELNNVLKEPTTDERLQMAEDTILFLLMGGM